MNLNHEKDVDQDWGNSLPKAWAKLDIRNAHIQKKNRKKDLTLDPRRNFVSEEAENSAEIAITDDIRQELHH